jgi:hypothetical protein
MKDNWREYSGRCIMLVGEDLVTNPHHPQDERERAAIAKALRGDPLTEGDFQILTHDTLLERHGARLTQMEHRQLDDILTTRELLRIGLLHADEHPGVHDTPRHPGGDDEDNPKGGGSAPPSASQPQASSSSLHPPAASAPAAPRRSARRKRSQVLSVFPCMQLDNICIFTKYTQANIVTYLCIYS